jgi:hypothetical protein
MPVTSDGEIVLTRDKSSGRVHRRMRLGDGLATLEGDNLDEAGAYEVLVTLANVDPADLCRNCFPAGAARPGGTARDLES